MCGFVVAFNPDPSYLFDLKTLERMGEKINHRGVDDHGVDVGKNVAMYHRRLSIVDIEGGHQPMWSHCHKIGLVFNGEIYNHKEIRESLQCFGFSFETMSDTEVILKAYERFGEDAFAMFDGMFSIVIWDGIQGKLVVARDRYGIKPLYQRATSDGTLLFASEIKALLAYDLGKNPALNIDALDNYLTLGYVLEPNTMYQGITTITKASCTTFFTSGRLEKDIYWSVGEAILQKNNFTNSDDDGVNLLREAISTQVTTEVPVGCFLSGGLDSSLICGLTQEILPSTLNTYSSGFSEVDFDESKQAIEVSQYYKTKHHCVYNENKLITDAKKSIDLYDTPFADNAALPTYKLSMKAKEKVKVVLSGDGADELFFGYRNHRMLMIEECVKRYLPDTVKNSLIKPLAHWYPKGYTLPRPLRAKSTLLSLMDTTALSYFNAVSLSNRTVLNKLYSTHHKKRVAGNETECDFVALAAEFNHKDPMKIVQYLDFSTYLPGSILRKVDHATMAAGIEARVPFLSNKLVDTLLPMDSRQNISLFSNKKQLRRWGKSILPPKVAKKAKKSFTSPLDQWFRAVPYTVICNNILTEQLIETRWFSKRAIAQLITDHQQNNQNHGATLWSLLILNQFLKIQ